MKDQDILYILTSFEQERNQSLEESKSEVESVRYYDSFEINKINFKNIFITSERDEKGVISYHICCGDALNELLSIDSEGKVDIKNAELKKYIEQFDLQQAIEENEKTPEKLKGISKKAEPEEIEQQEEVQDDETQQIEQDLQGQGEDLQISKYRKIKDSHISERMPEVFQDGAENGIAFSNKLNRYVIISKVNGQYQINENVEPAKMTWKTIISIDADGQKVERKIPYALMKLPDNNKKEIAVTLDQYGDASIETVDVLPCQERIARAVRHQGQGIEHEETREMRREFETEGTQYPHEIAHQVQAIEENQKDLNETVDYSITPDDYIPNTKTTWGMLMEETGESLTKLIERYNKEIMAEKHADSKDVVEIIKADYAKVNRQHTQN